MQSMPIRTKGSLSMMSSFAAETAKVLGVLLISFVSLFTLLLSDSLLRGWWQCREIRSQNAQLPPPLPLALLRMALTPSPSVQNCFAAAEQWFRISKQWSLEILPGFWCVRRFVLVANEDLLKHILVTSNHMKSTMRMVYWSVFASQLFPPVV
jgi:hypothetical protein